MAPVCHDAVGETWLGFAESGAEAGRPVMLTICSHDPVSLVGSHLIEAAVGSLAVRHPDALAFLEVAHTPNTIALVGEEIEGQPLSTLLAAAAEAKKQIPPAVAVQIMREAINAFSALNEEHPNAVGHGGLCPDAIFVASYGETMLRQPGIVSAAMKLPDLRRHPTSLPYQAPEFLRDARENEETADVFSAGVMLWEMLVGRPLFGAKDHTTLGRKRELSAGEVAQMERRVSLMEIPSLSRVQRAGQVLPPDLIRLVDWALKRDPAARPQSLADLSRAITCLPHELQASSAEVGRLVSDLAGEEIRIRRRTLAERLRESQGAINAAKEAPVSDRLELDAPGFDSMTPAPIPGRSPEARSAQRSAPPQRAVPPRPVAADLPYLNQRLPSAPPPAVPARSARTPVGMWLAAAVALFAAGGASSYYLFGQPGTSVSAQAEPTVLSNPSQPATAAPSESFADATDGSETKPQEEEKLEQDEKKAEEAEPSKRTRRSKVKPTVTPAKEPQRDTPFRPAGL